METQLGMPLLPFLGNYQSYVAKLHTQYNLSGILGANLQTLAVLSHTFPSVTEGVHHTVGFINSKSTMMKGMGVRGVGSPLPPPAQGSKVYICLRSRMRTVWPQTARLKPHSTNQK